MTTTGEVTDYYRELAGRVLRIVSSMEVEETILKEILGMIDGEGGLSGQEILCLRCRTLVPVEYIDDHQTGHDVENEPDN